MNIEITSEDVEALSHLHPCGPLISGLRCEHCLRAQTSVAQARALVDPLPTVPGSAVELPLAQPRARIAASRAR
jgi:hypothetical protein